MIKKAILVKYEFIGYHRWKDAPDAVGFLRDLHRHMFHVEIEFPINHNDRDLEFYLMREEIKKAISEMYLDDQVFVKGKLVESCEQIAEDLIEWFEGRDQEWIVVRVTEDGDNGSVFYNL